MTLVFKMTWISAALCGVSAAAVHSGKASAEWLAASATYQAGKPVMTAVRLVVDDGWHTYWENPGEAGMKISVAWELPSGWTAGDLKFPVPVRFKTGELAGFGYSGSVIFPVEITPPASANGQVQLKGKVSWLTCNEKSCVPGTAPLELVLAPGPETPGPDAQVVEQASWSVPRPAAGLSLAVKEKGKALALTITGRAEKPFLPAELDVFPATYQAIDPAAEFHFERDGDGWTALVTKNEYATKPLQELTLVFSGAPPFSVKWTAPKTD